MVSVSVLCMNGGDGAISYANNSLLQKRGIGKARPLLEETIRDMLRSYSIVPTCFKVADLGCSSGPNTLLVTSEIIEIIHGLICRKPGFQFQVFLNDLPGNDFNTVFKSLPDFYRQLKNDKFGPCFISGVPGSFYDRLFPDRSMHFIHSSYSVHWLSKVPENLGNINKENICMAKSSPPDVFKAYLGQFQRDFSSFLSLRSEEMVSGGRMFLTFMGRSIPDPWSKDCCHLYELLSKSLLELVDKGLVEEADVDSFNIPLYTPCEEEVNAIITNEGSFNLDIIENFELKWYPNDDASNKGFVLNKDMSGENVANYIRAVAEPMLATHFGDNIMDPLFATYAKHVAEHLSSEKYNIINIVVSVTRK